MEKGSAVSVFVGGACKSFHLRNPFNAPRDIFVLGASANPATSVIITDKGPFDPLFENLGNKIQFAVPLHAPVATELVVNPVLHRTETAQQLAFVSV
jgi:hypothetical protein